MKVTGEDDIARLGEAFNKMAQNLQLKIQQLEELSRMQRRFVSDVSHELRTPLTTVRMAADVIHEARVDFDPVTARSAELLADQLDRFESLLSDLLEISRFDAGAAALEAEPIDLREVVRRVVGGAEPLAERKGTRIRVVGDEQPVVAEADARRVERVLRNLVVNAVEHGEGRDVVVRLAVGRRRGRGRRAGLRGRAQARRGDPGVQPLLAGRPGTRAYHRRYRPRAVHRPGGRAAARRLAAGVGRAGRRFAVPADAAADRGRAAARLADTAGARGLAPQPGSRATPGCGTAAANGSDTGWPSRAGASRGPRPVRRCPGRRVTPAACPARRPRRCIRRPCRAAAPGWSPRPDRGPAG